MKFWRRWILLGFVSLLALPATAATQDLGAVATQHPLATAAAERVLQESGNAIDAGIAAALTLAVVEPYNSGLGGGGFALLWDGKTARALDFRETAPSQSDPKKLRDLGRPDLFHEGPFAMAVPGTVAGLEELHRRFGKRPWASLFREAIFSAESGFAPDKILKRRIAERKDCLAKDYDTWKTYRAFLLPENAAPEPVPAPEKILQPELAETLKLLRDQGAKAFYQGKIGEALIQNLQGKGAPLLHEDLKNYRTQERNPLRGDFEDKTLWSFPPPSAGGLSVLLGLNVLKRIAQRDPEKFREQWPSWFVRVLEEAFRLRQEFLADPAFIPPLDTQHWLSTKFAKQAEKRLSQQPQAQTIPQDETKKTTGETSHLSIIDAQGLALSMTLTLNLSFGSCITAGSTGILMNNEMDDFTLDAAQANAFGLRQSDKNAVQPGKRPLSSMSPTIVTEKKRPVLALGAPGGPRIVSTVLRILTGYFLLGESLPDAVRAPRLHYQGQPDQVFVEENFPEARKQSLPARKLRTERPWSNAQVVRFDPRDQSFAAVSDPRGIGQAKVVRAKDGPRKPDRAP